MSTNVLPAALAALESRSSAGLLLVNRRVTPPCPLAPSCPVIAPCIRPEPTLTGSDDSVMVGAETVTCADPAPVCTKPGALATIVVRPAASGSNATPPAATVLGESELPGTIVTVRL